jgi:hypothetical protein
MSRVVPEWNYPTNWQRPLDKAEEQLTVGGNVNFNCFWGTKKMLLSATTICGLHPVGEHYAFHETSYITATI